MSLFLDSIANLNNQDLNTLDDVFLVDTQIFPVTNPSYDNWMFYTGDSWDIIEHDLCHCLIFALEGKFDRLYMKDFGYPVNIVDPLTNALEEWKVLKMQSVLSPEVKKKWDDGDFREVPAKILERGYPESVTHKYKHGSKDPTWHRELHPEFQPKLIEFNALTWTLPAYTLDDVRTAVTKLKEYFHETNNTTTDKNSDYNQTKKENFII